MSADPRVFVSYSRQDGQAVAADLRARLAAEGLSLWQDLVAMEGGRDWWHQIEEAITRAEYLVLVLTPGSLASEVCAKEWRYARQQGTYVIPVSDGPPGRLDLSRLAGWMRRADIVDLSLPERRTWLVNKLKQPPQVRRVPMMAEAPPAGFVPRPAEFDRLKAALLDPASKDAVAITAALRGAGGYGKTTLARALCADPDIQDAYDDGILWVTLGEAPGNLLGRIEDLLAIISGIRPGFSSVEAASVRLEEILADQRMLIVIDDLWDANHASPLLRGGPHCARLITTRNSDTLPNGVMEQPVDQMRTAEALDMLRLGLPAGEEAALLALAARLGEWPLLLSLVNGALIDRVVRAKAPLADAIDHVVRLLDRRGLTAFDARDASHRHNAVAITLAASLERLSELERVRLRELAVFPEDAEVPLATVGLLWQQTASFDDLDTEELLEQFYRLSLLLDLDLRRRIFTLHDVIRAWLRQELGLDGLTIINRALVEGYRRLCPDGWHAGPHDYYFERYFLLHLRSVDRTAWRSLLLDPRWIYRKITDEVDNPFYGRGSSLYPVTRDYDTSDDDGLMLVGDTLNLSEKVLLRDPDQLPSQLCGRFGETKNPDHRQMVATARTTLRSPALLPRRGSLGFLDRPLRRNEWGGLWINEWGGVWIGPGWRPAFEGHGSAITAMAVLPDGCRALSASLDHSLRLWDLESGAVLRTLVGHDAEVTAVAVLLGGQRAVSASEDRTLKLWDLNGGVAVQTLVGHRDWVNAVMVLSDGSRALSASDDWTLKLWDLGSGVLQHSFTGHTGPVNGVALHPDGRHAVSSSLDGTLKLWDLESGDALRTLESCPNCTSSIAILPEGRHVLCAADVLVLLDLESGASLRRFDDYPGGARTLALSADASRMLLGTEDGVVQLCGLESNARPRILGSHNDMINAVAFLPNSSRALSASADHTVKLWELATGSCLATFTADAAPRVLTALSDHMFVVADQGGSLHLLDLVEPLPSTPERV